MWEYGEQCLRVCQRHGGHGLRVRGMLPLWLQAVLHGWHVVWGHEDAAFDRRVCSNGMWQ